MPITTPHKSLGQNVFVFENTSIETFQIYLTQPSNRVKAMSIITTYSLLVIHMQKSACIPTTTITRLVIVENSSRTVSSRCGSAVGLPKVLLSRSSKSLTSHIMMGDILHATLARILRSISSTAIKGASSCPLSLLFILWKRGPPNLTKFGILLSCPS